MSELRQENEQLKQLVAELSLKNRVLKKKHEWTGLKPRRYMRYTQSEKMQILRLVEESPVSIKQTLLELNINRSTFYKWYRRYQEGGFEALANRYRPPKQFWNAVQPLEKKRVVETALEHPEKSPRELAWYITDNRGFYVSESTVYRILKANDLVTSPVYTVFSARDKFPNPTRAPNELWQTDFTLVQNRTLGLVLSEHYS